MLRQNTGPATIAGNKTSASSPSSSCSLTRCSAEPVPAASATLRPKGCQVPSARPARRSRKLASSSGCPSISWASPPSGRRTVRGARSRYFSGTLCDQRSGGTSRCPSADISLYCLAIANLPRSPPSVYQAIRAGDSPLSGDHDKAVILVPVAAGCVVVHQFEVTFLELEPVGRERTVVRHLVDDRVYDAALPDEMPAQGEGFPAELNLEDDRSVLLHRRCS